VTPSQKDNATAVQRRIEVRVTGEKTTRDVVFSGRPVDVKV
jgi:hypothetical protein